MANIVFNIAKGRVVSLPDRRTETEVQERDDDGNIRKVVHTETTIQ